jgi:outer membrane protein assembly factor BamB
VFLFPPAQVARTPEFVTIEPHLALAAPPVAVIPVLIGPLQVLIAILPGLLAAVFMAILGFFKPRALRQFARLLWRLKYHVIAIALCAAGIRWAVIRFRPQTSRAAGTAAAAASGDWTTFRGSLQRTGTIGGTNEPSKGQVNWMARRNERFYASPAVVGKRVYVATAADISPFDKEGTGSIRCFDADTGAELWSSRPSFSSGAGKYRATFASPVIKGSLLVCGEGLHETKRCRVVCLDLTPGHEGRLVWSRETAGHVECTPAIATVTWEEGGRTVSEDRVFVGAGDVDGYYALDLKTGALRWHLDGKEFPDAETALAVLDNRVYAGLGNSGKAVCAIDAVTGKLLRRVPTPYPVFAPPAVANGKLLVGMGNGDFVASAAALGLPSRGELWCLDRARLEKDDGAQLEPDWKVEVGDTILGAIATDGDTAWFCSANGWLYCVDLARNGAIRGKWNGHDAIKGSPALTARFAYVVTESGTLYAVNRETFETVWAYKVGAKPLCASSPAIAHGRVYVGTEESGFVCAGEPAPPEPQVWSGRLAGPERAGNYFGSPPPECGQFAWYWPPSLDGSTPTTNLAAPVATLGESMLVAFATPIRDGPRAGVVCMPAQSARRDGPDPVVWSVETTNGVRLSPAMAEHVAFFVDGEAGDPNRHLHAVDTRKGRLLWRRPVATEASGVFSSGTTDILIQDEPGRLTAAAGRTGRVAWSVAVAGALAHAPVAHRHWVAVATVSPPTVSLLDRPTGRTLWTAALTNVPAGPPIFSKRVLHLPTSGGIEARGLSDGRPLPAGSWQAPAAPVSGDVAATRGEFIYVTGDGSLLIVDRGTGRPRCEPVPGALAGSSPLPGGNAILYMRADCAVMKVRLDESESGGETGLPRLKPKEWVADTASLGKPTTPMVLAGGNVYMGMTGWGLVCLGPAK